MSVADSRDDGRNGLPDRFGDLVNGLADPDESEDEKGEDVRAGRECARAINGAIGAGAVCERVRRCCREYGERFRGR